MCTENPCSAGRGVGAPCIAGGPFLPRRLPRHLQSKGFYGKDWEASSRLKGPLSHTCPSLIPWPEKRCRDLGLTLIQPAHETPSALCGWRKRSGSGLGGIWVPLPAGWGWGPGGRGDKPQKARGSRAYHRVGVLTLKFRCGPRTGLEEGFG